MHSLVTRELDALVGAEQGMALVEYEVLLKLTINGGRMRMSDLADVAFHREGNTWDFQDLGGVEAPERYALCRCGQSAHKPICDGSPRPDRL